MVEDNLKCSACEMQGWYNNWQGTLLLTKGCRCQAD